jgi:UDP-N-acetylmuramate dehydrogenase
MDFKGVRIGGAEVSGRHANFIVNKGDATSKEVKALIKAIQTEAGKRYGLILETEIVFLGSV